MYNAYIILNASSYLNTLMENINYGLQHLSVT